MKVDAVTRYQASSAPSGATKVRFVIVVLCFIGLVMNYLDRANLSVALPYIDQDLGLNMTNKEKGLILGAFFWAYDGAMLAAGWFTDKVGPRIAFASAAIWWSFFTMITPLASGFWSLFGMRFALGAGEAPAYPSSTKAASSWVPQTERAFATAVIDSGSRVGTVAALPIVTAIMAVSDWHTSFVILGLVGFAWAAVWIWYYREPAQHSGANDLERDHIVRNGGRNSATDDPEAAKVKWKDLFRYRTVRGMMFGFFCLNFVIYFILTWFPSYLKTARGLSLAELGTLGTLPGLTAIAVGWFVGINADKLIKNGYDVTLVRKTLVIGGLIAATAVLAAALAESIYAMLFFFAVAYSGLACAATGIWCYPADIAPSSNHVASIGGIQNFASNLAGIISPVIFGAVLDYSGGSYTPAFAIAAVVAILGALTYAFIVGPAKPLPPLPARR